MLKFVCWRNVLLEKHTRSCKMKLCLWDLFGTVSSHKKCRLPLLQNNIVRLENLTQANNKVGVVVIELNGGSSSKFFYLSECNFKVRFSMVLVYIWAIHWARKFTKEAQILQFSTIQISKYIFSAGPMMVTP